MSLYEADISLGGGHLLVLACATDRTKRLVKSVGETALKSLFRVPSAYQDLRMHHDWPVNPLNSNIKIEILIYCPYTIQ